MTETIPPTPVDPARVLAALEVLGWPDDRENAAARPGPKDNYLPGDYLPGVFWELAADVIRAADAASSEPHVIEIRADGWTIQHPLSCRPRLFECPVNRAAEATLDGPPAPVGHYECGVNDIGDRFLLGDQVEG
ncbi:DUF6085 family protein [Micromonospora sp. NPDC048999]|uniref:DUF6085 family protein n=1 Tax=Micromonospora sp. NPDC048999 TaxID=3155391 RepID=UPI0033F96573